MSLNLYDDAMLEKFRGVFPNSVFAQPDQFFIALEELNGSGSIPKLPAISIYRSQTSIATQISSFPDLNRGRRLNYHTDAKADVYNARSIPMRLEYTVEFWSKEKRVLNELTEQIVFWLFRKPELTIKVPMSAEAQDFTIQVSEDIVDNTELSEFGDKGRLYRSTLTLIIDSARIFNVYEKKTVLLVDVDISNEGESTSE
ncbi:hypothetical protein SP15_041 [Bacillus phage SP-15]|uniref:Uncharacterized protein n=1 Tax=Bacillus phage SP-15 TaxID=1792032 RepID=A0A127AW02_9CAUD|nr:hypothetical protein SP15_041 [Bacillus phage SP-15]AMM44840.1 hypothetical protein SP15_041 [Bacillus phage SP-15]